MYGPKVTCHDADALCHFSSHSRVVTTTCSLSAQPLYNGYQRPHRAPLSTCSQSHKRTRNKDSLRTQSRHRRLHVHLPIPHRRETEGRRAAHERCGRNDEPSHGLVLPHDSDCGEWDQACVYFRWETARVKEERGKCLSGLVGMIGRAGTDVF